MQAFTDVKQLPIGPVFLCHLCALIQVESSSFSSFSNLVVPRIENAVLWIKYWIMTAFWKLWLSVDLTLFGSLSLSVCLKVGFFPADDQINSSTCKFSWKRWQEQHVWVYFSLRKVTVNLPLFIRSKHLRFISTNSLKWKMRMVRLKNPKLNKKPVHYKEHPSQKLVPFFISKLMQYREKGRMGLLLIVELIIIFIRFHDLGCQNMQIGIKSIISRWVFL